MFTANSPAGKLVHVTSAALNRKSLNDDQRNDKFRCPECGEKVFIRGGTLKVKVHFAHRSKTSCSRTNETEAHALAKTILFRWMESYGYKPVVEKVLPDAENQRADIFVHIEGKKVILEIQQSAIPESEFVKRHRNYAEAGYKVLWIGVKHFTQKVETRRITVLEVLRLRTHPFQHGFSLDIDTGEILFEYGHTQLQSSRYIYEITSLPLKMSPAVLLFPEKAPVLSNEFFAALEQEWKKTTELKRKMPKLALTPAEKKVIYFYQQYHLNLNYYPALCYLPVPYGAGMKISAEVWQSWILFNYVQKRRRIEVNMVLEDMLQSLEIICYSQSSHFKNSVRISVREYLSMLTHAGALIKIYPGVYYVAQTLTINKSLDTLHADDRWIRNMIKKYFECKNN